jgi:hypothetical protein
MKVVALDLLFSVRCSTNKAGKNLCCYFLTYQPHPVKKEIPAEGMDRTKSNGNVFESEDGRADTHL